MSIGSLKDLTKVVSQAVTTPETSYPLSKDLLANIQAYLDKHDESDEHDFQRLHDELLTIHATKVDQHPERHAVFLAILRELRPALNGVERLMVWWDCLIGPTLDSLGSTKNTVADARDIVLSLLIYDDDEDDNGEFAKVSEAFTTKLFEVYLEKTKLLSAESHVGFAEEERQRFVGANIESVLLAFGKRKPKPFLKALDSFVVQKESRLQTLGLLCSFVRLQGPHLYQIIETPLLEHLLQCLQNDTSTTVISLAITSLIMFMPHIPNAMGPLLPRIFAIYSRLLCWDRYGNPRFEDTEQANNVAPASDGVAFAIDKWQKLDSSFETASSTTPDVSDLFTFLYGLYPINFTTFLQNPYRYFEKADAKDLEEMDIDEDTVQNRSDIFRQRHLLHPNFMKTTAEKELTDKQRWMKSEPADVVAQCIGLVAGMVIPHSHAPGSGQVGHGHDLPGALVPTEDIPHESLFESGEKGLLERGWGPDDLEDEENTTKRQRVDARSSTDGEGSLQSGHTLVAELASNLSTPSFRPRDFVPIDSPTLPPTTPLPPIPGSTVADRVQDMMHLHGTLKSSKMNDSVSSLPMTTSGGSVAASPHIEAYVQQLSLDHQTRSPAIKPANSDAQGTVAFLQREVMLLKNDLNFERYLKQQHLSHIGHLQRKHIKESTVEAETQQLLNTNKSLKRKLEEAAKTFQKLKDESVKTKMDSKKWETELNGRIKKLREEKKVWAEEEETVKAALANARAEANQLRRLVVESEAKELLSRQRMQTIESTLSELDQLRTHVDQLNAKLADYESRSEHMEVQRHGEEAAIAQVDRIKLRFNSREQEREKMKRAYDLRINELEIRIATIQLTSTRNPPPAFQSMIDSALAASVSRLASLKKAHNHLLTRYTELEIKYIELQAANELEKLPGRSGSSVQHYMSEPLTPLLHSVEENHASTSYMPQRASSMPQQHQHQQFQQQPQQHHYHPQEQQRYEPMSPKTLNSPPLHVERDTHMSGNLSIFPQSNAARSHSNNRYPSRDEGGPSNNRYASNDSGGPSYTHQQPSEIARENNFSPHPLRGRPSMPENLSLSADNVSLSNSVASAGSDKDKSKKAKIKPQSEIRIRGRGGVQNIGKKEKEKREKAEAKAEKKKLGLPTGSGLAGIRGFT